MTRKQLILLLICTFQRFLVGTLQVSLLPVLTARLGANASDLGVYFGLCYAALTAGAFTGGWLSSRFRRRKPFIIGIAFILVPASLGVGLAGTMTQLTLATVIDWYLVGTLFTLLNILTGMYAGEAERGRIFGIVAIGQGLAQVTGGLLGGVIVSRWNFMGLFAVIASLELALGFVALLLEDRVSEPRKKEAVPSTRDAYSRNTSTDTLVLMIASVLAHIILYSSILARPMVMNNLGFDLTAISGAVALAGLVSIPLPFLMGWLSDYTGRRKPLALCYLLVGAGALVMANAGQIWQFQLTAVLSTFMGSALPLGTALMIDSSSRTTLSANVSRYNATPWIGGIVGCVISGIVIQAAGIQATFLGLSTFAVIALMLLFPVHRIRSTAEMHSGG
jgi:MFS family permease